MSTTLKLYYPLASSSKEQRVQASAKLVQSLEHFQSLYTPPVDPELSESTPIDVLNAEDVTYALRRLARGLASPNESSRLGFAVALTEVSGNYNRAAPIIY